MRITKRQEKQLQNTSEPLKDLIKRITDASEDELPSILNSNLKWDTSKGSLLNWISVLNKFDEVLEGITTRYQLSEEFVKPVEFDSKTTELLISVLKFTALLLENCTFKSVYSSSHRLFDLLNSPTVPVIIAVLECFVILAKKFSAKSMRTTFISQRKVSDRLYPMALFLPAATLTSNTGSNDNYSLIDFIKDNAQAPEKWKQLEYFYFVDESRKDVQEHITENSPSINRVKQHQHNSSPSKKKKSSSSSQEVGHQKANDQTTKSSRLFISEEEVHKLTLQQLYDKGSEKLPSKYWMRFSLKALLAKAFNSNTYESIKLRQDLVVIKALATSILVTLHEEFEVSSRIFEADPTLLSSYIDLINLQNPVPRHVRIAAAKVLECISSLKTWSSEIVRALSGSVSHGLLFQNLRQILKELKAGNKDDVDEEFNLLYFSIIANIISTKPLSVVLVSAGLIQLLTEFLSVNIGFRSSLTAATNLLDSTISNISDNVSSFRDNDGFRALVDATGFQIDFALENPGYYGPPPTLTIVHYSISFQQANNIRSLLRFAHHLIQRESGDRVRNLFDSPLLISINKVLTNIPVFGYTLLTLALNIVASIIHNEPTAYPILKEAGTVDIIMEKFDTFAGKSSDLISALPHVIGAIALNNEGLDKIIQHKVVGSFFKIFDNPDIAKTLVNDEHSDVLGSAIDELARHYPVLKPIITKEIVSLIERLPAIGATESPEPHIYTSEKGWFYHSRDDEIIDDEEGAGKLETWESIESAYVLESAAVFLSSLIQYSSSWTSITESLPAEKWLPLLCLRNSPFDYVYSNTMYPLKRVLKYLDDDKRTYAIKTILQETAKRVDEISDFASSEEKGSLFLKLEGNIEASNDLFTRLISANNILFAFTDIYCNPTSLSSSRVEQLAKYLADEQGLKLIKTLGLLMDKVSYEEDVLRSSMPESVVDETFYNQFDDGFPPLKIVAKESNDDNKLEKTSAKFKNAVQVRFILQRIHTSISIIFNTLLSLPTISRADLSADAFRGFTVLIAEEIARVFKEYLNLSKTASHSHLLTKLHTIHYCMTDRNIDRILTVGGIVFMQLGGFLEEKDILQRYWMLLVEQDNDKLKDKKPAPYVTQLDEEVVAAIVLNILVFFNKVNSFDQLVGVSHGPLFYEGDISGSLNVQANVLRASFSVQGKLLSFGCLSSILEEDSFSSLSEETKLPQPIVEEISKMVSKVFLDGGAKRDIARSDGTLFELHWREARISRNRIDYLKSLGLTEEEAIKVLGESGGDLSMLESDSPPSGFSDDERWTEIFEKAKTLKYAVPEPKLVVSQFNGYHTIDDLEKLRLSKSEFLIDQLLYLVQLSPKIVGTVSEYLIKTFLANGETDVGSFEENILQTILEFILSFEIPDADSQQLGAMLNLFGMLLANDVIFSNCRSSIDAYSSEIIESLKSSQVNYSWFSKALLGLEKLVVTYRLPTVEPALPHTSGLIETYIPEPPRLSRELYDQLFETLINVGEITNVQSSVSVAWVLSLYACEYEYATRIIASGVIPKIAKTFDLVKPESEERPALQAAFIELTRRCYESDEFLQEMVIREIRKQFYSRNRDGTFDRKRDLKSILRESYAVVLRAPDLFVQEFSKRVRFCDFRDPLQSLALSYVEPNDVDTPMVGADDQTAKADGAKLSSSQTGILHTILTELMSTAKKDWLSDPPLTPEEQAKKDKDLEKNKSEIPKPEKTDVHKNTNCSYLIYLLKCAIELLSSYKHSKLEFLTFSKKQLFQGSNGEVAKPRSTALNFILHQLLLNPVKDLSDAQKARRNAVGDLAVKVVNAFISSVDSRELDVDPKKVDPDLTYIRKFTIDTIHKVLKEVFVSTPVLSTRYDKIVALGDLLSSLLSSNKNRIVDASTLVNDDFEIAKVILESSLTTSLSQILSDIDPNHTEYFFVLQSVVNVLEKLGTIKANRQDLFRASQQNNVADEEEVEEDENDFKEETPDLFQNSTLGMYDVAEIDSEDDYSDEEIGFEDHDEDDDDDVDDDEFIGDGRPIEIVYSEDDGEDLIDDEDEEDEDGDVMIGSDEGEVIDDGEEMDSGLESDDSDDTDDSGSGFTTDAEMDSFDSDYDTVHGERAYNSEELDSELEEEAEHIITQDLQDGSDTPLDPFAAVPRNSVNSLAGDALDYEEAFVEDYRADEDDEHEIDDDDDSDDDSDLGPSDVLQRGLRSLVNSRDHHHHHVHSGRIGRTNGAAALETLSQRGWRVVPGTNLTDMNMALELLGLGTARSENRGTTPDFSLRSTRDRWTDLYNKGLDSFRVAQAIINNIYEPSKLMYEEKMKEEDEARKKREDEERKRIAEEEERQRIEEENKAAESEQQEIVDADANTQSNENATPVEPVLVMIGDRQVDIAGTDIDPEFFEALPDYMREEVFTEHITARRAAAAASSTRETDSREIDQDFLDALPDSIREEILAQEAVSSRLSDIANEFQEADIEAESPTHVEGEDESKKEKKQKVYFTPLIDRFGVASLIKFVFVPQSFQGRAPLYELFAQLCINKQTRAEVMGYLMAILQYGINDQNSLERIFNQIAASVAPHQAGGNAFGDKPTTPRTPTTAPLQLRKTPVHEQFPHRATPFVVATQVLEALQFLLETEPQLRFYFLTEHESLIPSKKPSSAKKLGLWKQSKYPLNTLLGLLSHSVVKRKSSLMDLLSRIIQVTTRSLNVLQKAKTGKEGETLTKKIELPHVLDSSFRNAVSILSSDDCSARTFQQVLSAMQNLLAVSTGSQIFASELSKVAKDLEAKVIKDLNQLSSDLLKNGDSKDFDGGLLLNFTPQSSDQSKLLRVLTALDYLFGKQDSKDSKDDSSTEESDSQAKIKELTRIYRELKLGSLWGALSESLDLFESNKSITHFATVLLPIIEALMVVCKHSKIQARDVLKFEEKKCDFANEPIESLFFSFTDTHKKILNHMVRSNPKLMSGPFSMLVKNPRVLEFDNKRNYFDRQLHKRSDEEKPVLQVAIRRDQVFLDSYRALFFKSTQEFRNSKLEITFKGEAGVDAGGVTREWYQVLSRQMFNADYALFLPIASDKTTFHPNRTSWVNPEHLSFFKFIGRVIGKAIFDNCFLDCHFTRDVYKSILGRPVSLKDLETIDMEYYKSLMWMLENDITDIIIETFSVDTDDYGEVKTVDLIPNGREIAVTEENKHEYVRLIVQYRLQQSVKDQVDNFLQGFHEIIPKELISIFDEQELELLISGLPDIDVDDWKNNTTYVNYTSSSKEISYFWRAVRSFDKEERAKLLQFATGTSKVPLNGFKELGGANGTSKFSIHKDFGSTDRLPSSHTCFNQIDLPAYDSYETLRGSLLLAITEGHEGFGLA